MTRLDELTIRSLGVIDEARVPVGAGFTAITGETGAGKTMLVQALALLRGERADAGVIRAGEERAAVQGVWIVDDAEAVALVEDDRQQAVLAADMLVERAAGNTGTVGQPIHSRGGEAMAIEKLLGGVDQSAIGTDLEDETVGKGRGCGTNTCTQCNDKRKRAVSCP